MGRMKELAIELEESKLARFKAICDKITVDVKDAVTVSECADSIRATVDDATWRVIREIEIHERCVRALVNITRLWNWADCQPDGTAYWNILKATFPRAFRDPSNTNSLRFTYN